MAAPKSVTNRLHTPGLPRPPFRQSGRCAGSRPDRAANKGLGANNPQRAGAVAASGRSAVMRGNDERESPRCELEPDGLAVPDAVDAPVRRNLIDQVQPETAAARLGTARIGSARPAIGDAHPYPLVSHIDHDRGLAARVTYDVGHDLADEQHRLIPNTARASMPVQHVGHKLPCPPRRGRVPDHSGRFGRVH